MIIAMNDIALSYTGFLFFNRKTIFHTRVEFTDTIHTGLSTSVSNVDIYHRQAPAWLFEIHGAQLGTNTHLVDRYAILYFHNIVRRARG